MDFLKFGALLSFPSLSPHPIGDTLGTGTLGWLLVGTRGPSGHVGLRALAQPGLRTHPKPLHPSAQGRRQGCSGQVAEVVAGGRKCVCCWLRAACCGLSGGGQRGTLPGAWVSSCALCATPGAGFGAAQGALRLHGHPPPDRKQGRAAHAQSPRRPGFLFHVQRQPLCPLALPFPASFSRELILPWGPVLP